jgi:hypothetical protein
MVIGGKQVDWITKTSVPGVLRISTKISMSATAPTAGGGAEVGADGLGKARIRVAGNELDRSVRGRMLVSSLALTGRPQP